MLTRTSFNLLVHAIAISFNVTSYISALSQDIASDLQKSDPQRAAEFLIEPSLEVEGDPRLLRVAPENLLGNAWKFSVQRRPARIELGLAEQNGRKKA